MRNYYRESADTIDILLFIRVLARNWSILRSVLTLFMSKMKGLLTGRFKLVLLARPGPRFVVIIRTNMLKP